MPIGVDMKGYLITFEGPDGGRKNYSYQRAYQAVAKKKYKKTIITREPGGSKFLENIRQLF